MVGRIARPGRIAAGEAVRAEMNAEGPAKDAVTEVIGAETVAVILVAVPVDGVRATAGWKALLKSTSTS